MLQLLTNVGKFLQKNWVPATALVGGVVIGVFGHKYNAQLGAATKKTGHGIAYPFVWFGRLVSRPFRKKKDGGNKGNGGQS